MAAQKFRELYEHGELLQVTKALNKISKGLPENLSLRLDFNVEVQDCARWHAIRFLHMGMTADSGRQPFIHTSSAKLSRYLVDGEVECVPHDCCPVCWSAWESKIRSRECPNCGSRLGKQVILLLDTDTCPDCKEGKVSKQKPVCDHCGCRVAPEMAIWG